MKASYATVKSEAEYQKRKTLDSCLVRGGARLASTAMARRRGFETCAPDMLQGKPPPAAKRARADENARERTTALIEELLERETLQLGSQPPPAQQNAGWVAAALCPWLWLPPC